MVTHIDDRFRFQRTRVAADAPSAAQTRIEFSSWLQRHFKLSAERLNDLLLAVNEALANAAEFAYIDFSHAGTLDVSAAYDHVSDTLAVTVNDRGRWRVPEPATTDSRYRIRGRGIPLMKALADNTTIDCTPYGTYVTLTWNRLGQANSAYWTNGW